jgi:hypothetical protein
MFYRIYLWNLTKWGKEDVPEFKAMFVVSIIVFNQLLCFILFAEKILKIDFILKQSKQTIIISAIILFVFNYFLLVYNKKYMEIARKFKNESKGKAKLNSIYLWSSIILVFGLNILLAIK